MKIPIRNLTFARLMAIIIASFAVPLVWPSRLLPVPHGPDIAAAALVGPVLAFLIWLAAQRRRDLHAAVYVELNKLRRIYHVSKNLANTSTKFRGWFTELHGRLHAYLGTFAGQSLYQYSAHNSAFRNLSYHIYTVPELDTSKEAALYDDLLKTTAVVAESRQRIKELVASRLSLQVWAVILLLAGCLVAAILLSFGDLPSERLAAGAVIAAAALAVELLWELDALKSEMAEWAGRYVQNVAKLEYKREE